MNKSVKAETARAKQDYVAPSVVKLVSGDTEGPVAPFPPDNPNFGTAKAFS